MRVTVCRHEVDTTANWFVSLEFQPSALVRRFPLSSSTAVAVADGDLVTLTIDGRVIVNSLPYTSWAACIDGGFASAADVVAFIGEAFAPPAEPARTSQAMIFPYKASTGGGPNPGKNKVIWVGGVSQVTATHLHISHKDADGDDLDRVLSLLTADSTIVLQDQGDHVDVQRWGLTGVGSLVTATDNYWIFPVTLETSGGEGTTGFANNRQLLAFFLF
jgi:hypothetical protein